MAYADTIFSLQGRVALVTGAAGYLGSSISTALAEAGAHVILNGRRKDALENLAQKLVKRGFSASTVAVDLLQSDAMYVIREDIVHRKGRLDIVVNNSYSGTPGTLDSTSPEDYLKAYENTVVIADRLLKTLKSLPDSSRRFRSFINIASMYGLVSPYPSIYKEGNINPPHYGAAKAGMLQWSRYAAVVSADKGIRVNSISPGPFPSAAVQGDDPEFICRLESKVPLARIGVPDELKGVVIFLASDASSYITGANIVVDGGWTAW